MHCCVAHMQQPCTAPLRDEHCNMGEKHVAMQDPIDSCWSFNWSAEATHQILRNVCSMVDCVCGRI